MTLRGLESKRRENSKVSSENSKKLPEKSTKPKREKNFLPQTKVKCKPIYFTYCFYQVIWSKLNVLSVP